MKTPFIAISDIHGCNATLKELIGKVPEDSEFIFLGDYIDRGNDSASVIDTLLTLEQNSRCVFLKGNHEDMFLNAIIGTSRDQDLFLLNGGYATIKSYQEKGCTGKRFIMQGVEFYIPTDHLDFFYELNDHYETDTHIFVHAGLYPNVNLQDNHPQNKMWIREDFLQSNYNWGKPVVHGHTPSELMYKDDRRIGIDTGCVFDRRLTAYDVVNGKQYDAKKNTDD